MKKSFLSIFLVLFFIYPVYALEKPADSKIAAVVADLDKYEKQAEGLTPSHKSYINRILRMLPMTESRLKSSRNKSHPSWIDASNRLKALKERLENLKAGKTPATASKTTAAAAGGSATSGLTDAQIAKKYQTDYRTLSNELRGTHISNFADENVVSGFKTKFSSLKSLVNSFKEPKYKKQFSANYESLEKWFNKKVESAERQAQKHEGKDAARSAAETKRQQKQKEVIEARKKAEAESTGQAAAELDFQNKKALKFFNKDYDRYVPEFDNITPANTPKLTGYIDRLENRLSKLTAKGHPEVVAAQQKVAALKAKLEGAQKDQPSQASVQSDQKTHKEFQRLYQRNRVALDTLDPAELSRPAEAKRWKKVLKDFDDIVAKFQNKANPDVKKDMEKYAEIKEKIESALSASTKLDIKSYPDYEKDLDYLNSLYGKYSEKNIFSKGNESLAKKLMASYANDKKAYDELNNKYAAFMKGNQAAYAPGYKSAGKLKRNFRNAGQWMDKFSKAQKEFVANAVPKIEGLMSKVKEMVDQAVKEKRPAWFTGGGIQNNMSIANSKLDSYASIKGESDPQVKQLRAKFSDLQAEVKKAEDELKEQILAATKMPADAYSGGDKKTILKMAVAEWKKKHSNIGILAKGIAMPNWERKTEWRFKSVDGTRYKVDRSYLQVWVIVKTSDRIATQYFIELNKNHMQGNKVTLNAPTNLQGDVFKTEMLLKNVKR